MIAETQTNRDSKNAQHRWQLQPNEAAGVLQNDGLDQLNITDSLSSSGFAYAVQHYFQRTLAQLGRVSRELTQSIGMEGNHGVETADNHVLHIPDAGDAAVPLLDLSARHKQIPKVTAVLGLAEDGSTVFHNFRSHDTPHMMVVGGKNAGKTIMLRTIAASLAICNRQSDLQLAVISPMIGDQQEQRRQATSWLPLNYLPHMLCDVAMKHTDINDLLMFLVQEVRYREARLFRNPAIVVVVDQADKVVSRGGPKALEALQILSQSGEDVGIHLVLSARRADREQLSPQLLSAVPILLRGRQAQEGAAGLPSAESIEEDTSKLLGEGDFLVVQGRRILRMQGASIDDYELHAKLTEMYRYSGILLALPQSTRIRIGAEEKGSKVTIGVADGVARQAASPGD